MARWRRKLSNKKKRLAIFLLVFFALFGIVIYHYTNYINPVIQSVSKEEINGLAMLALNSAASDSMTDAFSYDDLIEISFDDEGNVKLIQANTVLINVLARTVTQKSQENINSLSAQKIEIPFGTMSGLSFLSGLGPSLSITVYPVGAVYSQMISSFTSAGINQTLHQLTLNIYTDISIILPGLDCSVSVNIPIVIAENVIVGEIPSTYVNSDDDNMLDLIP